MGRHRNFLTVLPFAIAAVVIGIGVIASAQAPLDSNLLIADANAADEKIAPAKASQLFSPVAAVLRHPRCMNCHPRDDRPRQGDDRHPHLQNIVRGDDNLGFVNGRCTACHRDENSQHSGVPGAPTWHLAPLSMGWQGLGDAELCSTLIDKEKNGGKDIAALVEHMAKDPLVLWGWTPGGDRTPVSTPHPQFVKELTAWADAGAPCPTAAK